MSKRWIKAAATDQTIDLFILDSSSTTGAGLTGLTSGTSGLTCYYRKGATGTAQQLTLASQTVGGAHTDGGFVAIDGTNMPGLYRLDLSDTMVATAGMLTIMLRGAANMAPVVAELEVVSVDIYDSTRFGLSALPNAAAEASGGLATLSAAQSSGGTIPANVVAISGDSTAADNLEAATDGTGYNVGGGSIVAASVTGAVGSVTGNVGGNVTGSVGSVTGNVGGNVVGSVASVTGNVAGSVNSVTTGVSLANNSINTNSIQNGAITNLKFAAGAITSAVFATDAITSTVIAADAITSAELAASSVNEIVDGVYKANITTDSGGSAWPANTFGDRLLRTDGTDGNEVKVTGSHHVAADVHEIQPATIVDADFATGSTYQKLSTMVQSAGGADYQFDAVALALAPSGGGGGGGSTTVRMGPFTVKAEGQASDLPLDINLGATHGVDCKLVDAQGTGVDLTGATLSTKVYSTSGTLVATISGTATYAAGGDMTWTIPTSVTNTAGTYTATITRTTGASDTEVFGPLRIYVRDI